MTGTEIVDLPEQRTAVVRATVKMAGLTDFFGRAFQLVSEALAAQGVAIVGEPFARYLSMPTDVVDVEAGFPVAGPVAQVGEVGPSALPACRAVVAEHVGPYDTLPETYGAVQRRMAESGLTPAPEMWERYLTDPGVEPDPARWRTAVVWPAVAGG